MSVTISLYRVVPNVTYNGCIFDRQTRSDYDTKKNSIDWLDLPIWEKEAKYGAPLPTKEAKDPTNHRAYCQWCEEYDEWVNTQIPWSDGKHHGKFEMYLHKEDMNYKEFLKLKEKYHPTIINTGFGYSEMNIPIEQIYYAQGWFFKKRFFNRRNTSFITTSKERMIRFLYYYIDLKYNEKSKRNNWGRHYEDLDKIIPSFIEKWEDDMIFECSF